MEQKSAIAISSNIDLGKNIIPAGDIYVFDTSTQLKPNSGINDRKIHLLYLYDVNPSYIKWCQEETENKLDKLKKAIAKEPWARVAASFFKDRLFFDFCGKLLCEHYHSFLKIVIKLKYLHDRYDEILCVINERYDLYDEFFLSLLPDKLRSAWYHTTFDVQRPPAKKEVPRRIWENIRLFVSLWRKAKWGRAVQDVPHSEPKYLFRLEAMDPRNYSLRSRDNDEAVTFRDSTFLVDGKSVDKEDLFFYLSSRCEDAVASLEERGYHVVDQESFKASLSLGQSLRSAFLFTATALLMRRRRNRLLQTQVLNSFLQYLQTIALAKNVPCRVHLSQLDIGAEQVIRAMALKHQGIVTAQYQDSINCFMTDGTAGPLMINLSYDIFFITGPAFAKNFQKHTSNIKQYEPIGLLRIRPRMEQLKKIVSLHKRTLFYNNEESNKSVITVFDENPIYRDTEDAIPNWKEMWGYLDDIFNTLREQTDYFFIYKPKLSDRGTFYAAWESEQKTELPFFELREKLRASKRVKVLDHRVDSVYAILLADIVIAPPFSTTGMEALAAGKKVIYYDFGSKFLSHKYSKIDRFVAHNFDELKDLIKYWKDADESKRQKVINALKEDVLISTEDPIAKFTAILDNELERQNV